MAQTVPEAKQPYEVFPLFVDFVNNMTEDEVVSAANSEVIAYNSALEDVSDILVDANSIVTVDRTKLQVIIKGGENNNKYKLSFRAWISDSKKLEEDIYIKVKD